MESLTNGFVVTYTAGCIQTQQNLIDTLRIRINSGVLTDREGAYRAIAEQIIRQQRRLEPSGVDWSVQ